MKAISAPMRRLCEAVPALSPPNLRKTTTSVIVPVAMMALPARMTTINAR